jgi:hypothetical protein
MVKTIFFSSDGDLTLNPIDGTPVFYTKVKESSEIGTNFQGFKESEFSFYRDTNFEGIQYSVYDLQPWKRGLLLSEKSYDKNNTLVASTFNLYDVFKAENLKNIGKLYERNFNPNFTNCASNMPSAYAGGLSDAPQLTFYSSISKTGSMKLINTVSNLDGVQTSTSVEYDNNLMQIAQSTIDSKQNIQKTETIYPSDVSYNTNNLALEMRARNMLLPLETKQIVVKGSETKIISHQKTVYAEYNGTNSINYLKNLLPFEVWVSKNNGILEKRMEFVSYYENGNPKEYNTDGQPTCLLWGYNDALIIAEVKNATFATVNSLLSSAEINLPDFSVSNLSTSQKVKLWNFQMGLQGALSTWYTHRPLVGIAEKYEPNSLKTSFEYDGLLRLKNVKDTNGKLIKSNTYNYKGQQ